MAALFAVPMANAATRVWVGGAAGNETNFDTAANWSPNGTPGTADDLTINGGAAFYPNVTGASTAKTITIADSSASLTISSGSLTMANNTGITNNGTFSISGTGSLLGNRNLVNNAGGRISFASSGSSTVRVFTNNSNVTVPDGVTISDGTVTVSNNTTNTGTFRIAGGTYTISAAKLFTNDGTVTISDGVLQWTATGGNADYSGTGTTTMTGGLLKIGSDYQADQLDASGGTVEFQSATGSGNLSVGGSYQFYNLQIDAGNFLSNATTFNVAGDWDNRSAGLTLNKDSTAVFNGSIPQTVGGTQASTFGNVTVNNASGVSLSNDTTVVATLLFTVGNMTTGSNLLTSGKNNGSLGTVVASAAGYIVGNLKKFVANTTNPTSFEIGTASFYTPMTIAPIGRISGAGSQSALLATSTTGEHPSISSSGIDSSRDVNSYWSVTPVGDTTWTVPSTGYTVTGVFPPGDIDVGADTSVFIIRRFLSPSWAASPDGTDVTRTSTSTQAPVSFGASTNSTLAFGDFVIGEPTPTPTPTTQHRPQHRRRPDPDADPNPNANTDPNPNADPNPNTDPDADPDTNTNPNTNTNPDTDANANADPNPNTDTNTNPDPDPNPNTDANPNSNLNPDPDTESDPHVGIHQLVDPYASSDRRKRRHRRPHHYGK